MISESIGTRDQTSASRQPRLRVALVASSVIVVATIAAATAVNASPTGIGWWDHIVVAVVVTVVAISGASASRWSLVIAIAATAPFTDSTEIHIGSAVALAAICILELRPVPGSAVERALTVGAAGVAVNAALRIDSSAGPLGEFGAPSVLAVAALAPLLITAHQALRLPVRRVVNQSVGAVAIIVATVVLLVAAIALDVRSASAAGVQAVQAGKAAAESGDIDEAAAQLLNAERNFDLVAHKLGARWTRPALLIPVMSQHLRLGERISTHGAQVAATAAETVRAANPETLRRPGGMLDLDAITNVSGPLTELEQRLHTARADLVAIDSPWLLPPAKRQLTAAADQLTAALPGVETAAAAFDVIPALAGADGPKRYFVLLATPAESRELGGFVGNYLELTMDSGSARITESGRIADLYPRGPATLTNRDDYPLRFLANRPEVFPQNWTGMPDFPMVARAVADLYASIGGPAVDGVMYVDPIGLATLLQLTGPIDVPGIDQTLTAETLANFLLVEQYGAFETTPDRAVLLDKIAVVTFEKLLSADIENPLLVGTTMGSAARGGHLQLITFDDRVNRFLESVHLDGAFPEPDDDDFLSVVQANGAANKIDSFLTRTVSYDVTVDPARETVDGVVTVDLHNGADRSLGDYLLGAEGAVEGWPRGTNLVHLSIYTPHFLTVASIAGKDVPVERQQEFGYQRYLVMVPVPLGETVQVRFYIEGELSPDESGGYRLTVANQALATPDDLTVSVVDSGSGHVETQRISLDEDAEFRFFQ